MGRKRPLRFIPNNETQTILVIGADEATMDTVRRLVALWDVPDKVDDSTVRYTKVIPIKYSKAELIVEAMKEAFRDLLSSTDKTFQQEKGDQRKNESGFSEGSSSVNSTGGMNFSFSGRLSFGVDQVTNSILVCCEKQLLELMVSTIESLDEAAKPNSNVEVRQIDVGDSESLKEALQKILGTRQPPNPQQQQQQQAQQNEKGQLNEGNVQSPRRNVNRSNGR